MAAFLVDTDVASLMYRGQLPDEFLIYTVAHGLYLSFATIGELWQGIHKAQWGGRRTTDLMRFVEARFTILPGDAIVARTWGELSGTAQRTGQTIAVNDCWIAATGLVWQLPLLTRNRKHFERVPGLRLPVR